MGLSIGLIQKRKGIHKLKNRSIGITQTEREKESGKAQKTNTESSLTAHLHHKKCSRKIFRRKEYIKEQEARSSHRNKEF